MRQAGVALALAMIVGVAACGTTAPREPSVPEASSASPHPPAKALPDGWRWESYAGVQVGVPEHWGWTSGSQRLGQWCLGYRDAAPAVGRPGPTTQVACPGEGNPPPGSLVAGTGDIVAFEPAKPADAAAETAVGDREVVTVGGVKVIIQTADPALREQIAATVHEAAIDFAGCSADHPAARTTSWRPTDAGALPAASDVEHVTACRYGIANAGEPGSPLIGSRLLPASAAQQLVRAMADAPEGSGPNAPEQCLHGNASEIIVLHVVSDQGAREIVLRYSDCVDNGFDDGTQIRELTKEAASLIFRGPMHPMAWGGHLSGVVEDLAPPK
ncbi:hypothetical protein [uncultured Aeromicrobium sp.]|uniref:hypothetical protein n=1 Tax=uncultured Aeromicrobium sp. TaxID=337820 RepID=UPI0025E45204|nr:hypothetical protein [uncultured Aeromicrobium sp.]